MQQKILIVVVVLLAVVAVALFFGSKYLFGGGGGGGGGNTITTTTKSTTVTINTATTTVRKTTTTIITTSNCPSQNATQNFYNSDFSSGGYDGWNVTGPGFGTAPFNIAAANNNTNPNITAYYGAPWSNYNGQYMATTFETGTTLQAGNLTSLPILASELFLNFRIVSSQSSSLYVEILEGNKPAVITHFNTYVSPPGVQNPQSTFENATIPLGTVLCQPIRIRVVAGITGSSAGGKNYIAIGDFYLSKNAAAGATQPVNQSFP